MATAAIPNDEYEKRIDEDYGPNQSRYSYSEESKKALTSLQTAYEEKNFQGKLKNLLETKQ